MNYYLNKRNNDLSLLDEESSILSTFFNTVNKQIIEKYMKYIFVYTKLNISIFLS